ncbi:MAG: PglZ domain-containing protein [Boseongicola sp. SB0677_bin_26]|nr:PglZ domain-containing protein [Boseongicola sp. SB0677_bin_26]
MSHLLHDYIAKQLARHVGEHGVVVLYDPRSEFEPFLTELDVDPGSGLSEAEVDGVRVQVASYDESMYALRAVVEPLVEGDETPQLVLYLRGLESSKDSPLMELELAGKRWEPQLRQLARIALQQRFTTGVIDELLDRGNLVYDDIAQAVTGATGGDELPSILKTIVGGGSPEAQLSAWLADPDLDAPIVERQAALELSKLIESRLSLVLPGEDISKWRAVAARFVLAVEFRSDLNAEPPQKLDSIPTTTADVERRCRSIAELLRKNAADAYAALADKVEQELGLKASSVDPLALGAIDTFRFEEQALLEVCAGLVQRGDYEQAQGIIEERRASFWLADNVDRQAQWEAIELAAALGALASEVEAALSTAPTSPSGWIEQYADEWHRLDRAQRRFEAWLPKLEEEPDERAVAAVRSSYEAVLNMLASGFTRSLADAGWAVEGVRKQTSIFDSLVRPEKGRVALFLVDAMRYEMGAELAERLQDHGEVVIDPAVGVLPSITVTGMAALMPGASTSYDIIEHRGKLAVEVDGSVLPDLRARKRHLSARIPSSVDLDLGELLGLSRSKLTNRIGRHDLIVVRSQEIDAFGEGGFSYQARSVMDTAINDLARAVRRLAGIGISRTVIASDHGHLFAAEDRDDSMRIDAPGGDRVELHRRCWIGRGGTTPNGCERIGARDLGNDTDLEIVFPASCGVFRAGGDLSFHHGGPTLQEMVIPVITVRSTAPAPEDGRTAKLAIGDVPTAITNRMFSVKLSYASMLGTDAPVMPTLMSNGRQVGRVGMALGADLQSDGSVALAAGTEATVGFMLDDDSVDSVRIVVLDPATDAELYRSPEIPVHLGVV